MSSLPLSDIVDVVVNLNARLQLRSRFDMGLIIGDSNVIHPNQRVKVYNSLDSMLEDGFTTKDKEFKAAQKYFSPKRKPARVAIGRWISSDIELEDKDFTIENELKSKTNAKTKSMKLYKAESVKEAVKNCRDKNTDWYIVSVCSIDDKQIEDVANYIENSTPYSLFFYTTSKENNTTSDRNSIMSKLSNKKLRRTLGMFSKTENAVISVMGFAMGANTGLNKRAFTLMHKELIGIKPDSLNALQVEYLKAKNGNYYVSRGSDDEYSMFEVGTMSDGTYFDEMLYLDILVNDMQTSIVQALRKSEKITQTESGMNELKLVIKPALEKMVDIGFIEPGIWTGETILDLEKGDMMPEGYRIMSEPIKSQSQIDREYRKAPPIYTPIKLAGAIHTVAVEIDVNR